MYYSTQAVGQHTGTSSVMLRLLRLKVVFVICLRPSLSNLGNYLGTFSLSLFYFHHSSRSSLLCLLSCVHLAGPVKVSVIESESAIIWAFFTFTTAVAVLCILSTAHRAHCTLCSLPALSRSRSKVNLSPKSIRRCCCLRLPAFAASVTLALPQSRNT